jgi:hypothetical protein
MTDSEAAAWTRGHAVGMKELKVAEKGWQAERAELRAEVERLRVDAERYRWLRGNQDDLVVGTHPDIADRGMTGVIGTYLEWIGGTEMDAAIDAALKEPK